VDEASVYFEWVAGHPVTLLRRGRVGVRGGLSKESVTIIAKEFQGWAAAQETNGYCYSPFDTPTNDLVTKVNEALALTLRGKVIEPALLEWFLSAEGITFCDARVGAVTFYAIALCKICVSKKVSRRLPCHMVWRN
jgi:hypothetical protein